MKVLFITPWYPRPGKSVNHGIFVRDQAAAIGEIHEVVLIAAEVVYDRFHICSYEAQTSEYRKVQEHRLLIKQSLPFYNQLNYFAVTLLYARRVVKKFKPDIIHGNIGYPGAFWSFVIASLVKAPFVVTEHFSQFRANFRSLFHKWTTLFAMRRASCLIAVSHHTANEIAGYVKKRPVVIGNMIDFAKFKSPRTTVKDEYPVFNIGFLGVLENHKKGLDILLQALANVKSEYILHIGGAGVFVPYYQTMANELGLIDKCRFHGFVSHWEVPSFMEKLDFFVSASRFESFGMAIVEAMAMGLPVVATDSGGPRDFINDKNGILVPKDNPEMLREGIIKMIEQYKTYDPIYLRRYAFENFSDEAFLKKINNIYYSLSSRRGKEN